MHFYVFYLTDLHKCSKILLISIFWHDLKSLFWEHRPNLCSWVLKTGYYWFHPHIYTHFSLWHFDRPDNVTFCSASCKSCLTPDHVHEVSTSHILTREPVINIIAHWAQFIDGSFYLSQFCSHSIPKKHTVLYSL